MSKKEFLNLFKILWKAEYVIFESVVQNVPDEAINQLLPGEAFEKICAFIVDGFTTLRLLPTEEKIKMLNEIKQLGEIQ